MSLAFHLRVATFCQKFPRSRAMKKNLFVTKAFASESTINKDECGIIENMVEGEISQTDQWILHFEYGRTYKGYPCSQQ